jgi:hypothetical protein
MVRVRLDGRCEVTSRAEQVQQREHRLHPEPAKRRGRDLLMDGQEKAMEERQTRNVQDLSFRKQTRKQTHELTKMQPQPQGPIAASTVHRQCINSAGHRQASEGHGHGHGHRHRHRRCVAGPRAVECFESESCFGRPTIRRLHDRICTSIAIAIADAANSGAQSRNARRRVQGQEPVAVSIVRARRGAVYVNMASPPLQPTPARFSPRQPAPTHFAPAHG